MVTGKSRNFEVINLWTQWGVHVPGAPLRSANWLGEKESRKQIEYARSNIHETMMCIITSFFY